jgi:ankyrin repeat protein
MSSPQEKRRERYKSNVAAVKEMNLVDCLEAHEYELCDELLAGLDEKLSTRFVSQFHKNTDIGIWEWLVANGISIDAPGCKGWPALHCAASRGDLSACKFFLERKANVDSRSETYGYTSLMHASENGHFDVCKFLIEHGADVNAEIATVEKTTSYGYAARNGHIRILELLKANGANVVSPPPPCKRSIDPAKFIALMMAMLDENE